MNQPPNSPEKNEKNNINVASRDRTKQKILKGVLIFSVAVIVLSLLVSLIDPEALVKKLFGEEDTPDAPIYFFEVDDELNSLENEEYLQKDHRMHYHDPYEGVTYSVEEEMLSEESDEVIFFYHYFDAVRRGDADTVSAMYSEQAKDVPDDFTLQMIYDITVEPQTEGGEVYGYRVDYMIYRNNGTFRDDVGSDTNRPLLITLIKEGGTLKIKSVLPYTTTVLK